MLQEALELLAHAAEKRTKDGYDLRHAFRKFDRCVRAGCWVLGAGCWVLGAGCWVLCWVLVGLYFGWVFMTSEEKGGC